ncbi:hypothetical protein DYB32_004680 [Aphanomyces invadans]|uniref:Lon proteolytic domain-containing protein n=1 Tax=Aphanomyces invadans TaxID=157072 RepID=A0A3R6VM39_9STRA|nr:hypothetical protein DYB32_004680 [Aphanomyces invadans]
MANATQANNGAVLYVSGEESVGQVKMRADRLAHASPNLYLASETNIESIVGMVQSWDKATPCAGVMVDSIQTMHSAEINSTAGPLPDIPMIIIGHITKSGDIAGPKVLEHIVDTVVQLDGEAHSPNRFLRCTKNRFGTTSEVGVLSMTDAGLVPLKNPLQAFLSPSSGPMVGVAVTIAVEGTRPIPVEIQTLSSRSFDDHHRTTCTCHGVSYDKLQLIFAVLDARANVSFRSHTAFVNIAQGYFLDEPCGKAIPTDVPSNAIAADLALAVALASSATKRPVVPNAVFFGELALSGMLRPAVMLEPRLAAASKIGVETCVIPRVTCAEGKKVVDKYRSLVNIRQVDTLVEALAFGLLK